MAYIGREPLGGEVVILDSIESQFNGVATSFNLTRTDGGVTTNFFPIASSQLLVSLGGVIQKPDTTGDTGFKINANQIVFAVAPPTGASCFIVSYGNLTNIGTPSDGTITPNKLSTGGIYWNTSGNVGIGTSSSTIKLINLGGSVTNTIGDTNYSARFQSLANTNQLNVDIYSQRVSATATGTWPTTETRVEYNVDGSTSKRMWISFFNESTDTSDNSLRFGEGTSTEWMRIKNGNVGIGTTNPTKGLDVFFGGAKIGSNLSTARSTNGLTVGFTNNTTFAANTDVSDDLRFLSIVNESTTANAMSVLGMRVNPATAGSDAMLDMKFVGLGTSNLSNLHYSFKTNSGFADRFTFSSTGNLGIGTTNPTTSIHIFNSSNNTTTQIGTRFIEIGVGTTDVTNNIDFHTADDVSGFTDFSGRIIKGAGSAGALTFVNVGTGNINFNSATSTTNETTRMFITSGGNVGIGTTNATHQLQVEGTTSFFGTGVFGGRGQAGSLNPRLQTVNPIALTSVDDTGYLFSTYVNNGNADYLHVYNKRLSANSGLGAGWSGNEYRIQRLVDATWMGWIGFGLAGTGGESGIGFGAGSSATNTAVPEVMRIRQSGNVGIGTTNPQAKLDIIGTQYIRPGGGDNGSLVLEGLSGAAAGCRIESSFVTGGHGPLFLKTGGNDRITILADGTVGIGTATPSTKLHLEGTLGIVSINSIALKASTASHPTVIHRHDGGAYYILLSNASSGLSTTFNSLRPLSINTSTGDIGTDHTFTTGQRVIFRTPGGASSSAITSIHYANLNGGTLSFEGTSGQLFSISNSFSDPLFTVSDVSGIPSIEVNTNGTVELAPFGGNVGIGITNPRNKVDIVGSFGRGAPVTKTGNFTVADTENWLICNGTGTITVTLPTASTWTGREIMIKTIAAQTVVSASSNVVPLAGGAAGTAILTNIAGRYATLVSDGTNWIIMQAN